MRFCASGADGRKIDRKSLLYCIQAGRNPAELLVVNLYFYSFIGLQFRAGQSTMPCLHKALDVVRHPKRHPTNIQASMTLPTRPYAIFSTFARHTKLTHKSLPCKRAKNANAQPTHPSGRNSFRLHQHA